MTDEKQAAIQSSSYSWSITSSYVTKAAVTLAVAVAVAVTVRVTSAWADASMAISLIHGSNHTPPEESRLTVYSTYRSTRVVIYGTVQYS